MSSHHVVRDQQEPALLIVDPEAINGEILKGLLEWNPTVIVTEDSWPEINDAGIKADAILLQSPYLSDTFRSELSRQSPVKILRYSSDNPAIVVALNSLITQNYLSVNIVATESTQNDLKPALSPFLHQLHITFYFQKFKSYFVASGKFEKWARKKQQFLIPDWHASKKIQSQGLTQNQQASQPVFIAVDHGKIIIDTYHHPFWLTEEL
ncbi:hypothetical protein QQ020_22300 [Fulvivirgaceae bacterium BMA12]|uniref:Thiamine pyrophosphokinase n=1 Tax=Agaribacillus aureus TaxID=3051825 RepID=A0ABT8LAP0_9BACT|nr:hypothetical protein [Fulvivirgaceae bacterium BMA12]